MPPRNLTSTNAKCRVLGCQTSVPHYSNGFPGMPQSHCTRCGLITWNAASYCSDYSEPLYPESDLLYRGIEWADLKFIQMRIYVKRQLSRLHALFLV
jgi:hypothetical protein